MKFNFWFLVQPFATLGFVKRFFSYVPKTDSKNVFILNGQVSDRKRLDINQLEIDGTNIHLVDNANVFEMDSEVFNDSINICFDFNSPFLTVLKKAKDVFSNIKVYVASELDTLGKMLGRYNFLDYKAIRHFKAFNSFVDGVLAFGDAAVNCFKKIGWKKVFQCHYIPDISLPEYFQNIKEDNDGYLYIGRNDFFYKRLNYLLKFFKCNPDLKLTIIGDYGSKKDKVKKKIEKLPNITRKQAIPVQEVFEIMKSKRYKCVIIPSRFDACNVNVYMSVMCGIPFICSTGSGEASLAQKAKCGFIFKNSYKNFKKCINTFMNIQTDELNFLCSETQKNKDLSTGFLMGSLYCELIKN